MASTSCPICGEKTSDLTLHFRKCKGADTSGSDPVVESVDELTTPTRTAKVYFSWTSASGFSYQSITLLSAFQQSIELYLHDQGADSSQYLSGSVEVPVGEFDGQLVFGGSYCYPLKKFLIEQDGDVVHLEMDLTKMDQNDSTSEPTTSGTYNQYITAYTTPIDTNEPEMQYNPAYSNSPTHKEVGVSTKPRLLMIVTPTSSVEEIFYEQGGKKSRNNNFQSMPNSTHRPLEEDQLSDPEYSQKLNDEGFTPATVKSKTGSGSATTRKNVSPYQETAPIVTMATTGTVTTSSSNRPAETFSVSQLNATTTNTARSNVSKEEYNRVCEDRDRLINDHARVMAQLEGKIKRLKMKLGKSADEPTDDGDWVELETELAETRRDFELVNRDLAEAKDRIAALENQITEYAGTVDDQNKVIQNYAYGDVSKQYSKVKELSTQLAEYSVKQQSEFRLEIENHLKIITKLKEENATLHSMCDKMTTDITQYRSQTKQLVKDIETKKKEVVTLREELQKGRGAKKGVRPTEMESLELETLKQKCDGWRDMAERVSEEVDVLRIQIQQLEQERDSLNQELQTLSKRLQMVQSNRDTNQNSRITELQKQIKELQDIRLRKEEEMVILRSEKTNLIERNTQLVTDCDPEEMGRMKRKLEEVLSQKRILSEELEDLREKYELHQQKNMDLKDQLERAADPQMLTSIEEKLSRYKNERDVLKQKLKEAEIQNQTYHVAMEKLKQKRQKYREICRKYEEDNKQLLAKISEKDQLIEFLQNIHGNDYEDGDTSGSNIGTPPPTSSIVVNEPRPPVNIVSSTQSLPVAVESGNEMGHTHSLMTTDVRKKHSLNKTHPHSSAHYIPSLTQDDTIYPIQARTKTGMQEMYVVKVDQDALCSDMRVVVKRKGGIYEEGVIKYVGYPGNSGGPVIGVQLDMKRTDDAKLNDGTYSDGNRYFKCPKGYGIYLGLEKVYVPIICN